MLGSPDTASQKASEAGLKVRETGQKAGEAAQKMGETVTTATRSGKATTQQKADDIAAEAQKAWDAQQGDSAWQKVRQHAWEFLN